MASLPIRFLTPFLHRFSRPLSEGQWLEKTVWKAERAWFLDRRKRRAKPGIEPLLIDLCPWRRPQISESSKGVCSLGRRAGFSIPPEKGRQGVSMKLSSRRKGESGAVPPPRSRRGKSGVFSESTALSFLKHTHRPTASDSLEEQLRKAKSSMVASPIPECLFY